jgi:hypothetical protein
MVLSIVLRCAHKWSRESLMLGWLVRKGQNSRVYMCIKTVLWDLESASQRRRASIHALTSLFRSQVFGPGGLPLSILDRPFDYSRNELLSIYEGLEEIRNANLFQVQHLSRTMQRIGVELPAFAMEHAQTSTRSFEVLLSTVGAGIAPDRRDDVRQIWHFLSGSFPYLAEAIVMLREVEHKTASYTETSTEMFPIESKDWIQACQFTPSAFTMELSL